MYRPSPEQCRAALAKGNAVRAERKKLKQQIVLGEVEAAQLLADPPSYLRTVQVAEFVMWWPFIGTIRARNMLRGLVHTPAIQLGNLGPQTRAKLAAQLDSL